MATKDSPYPPSARRQAPSTGSKDPKRSGNTPTGTPAGKKDDMTQPPEKDDPHWAPESGDKMDER
jgi:hypothetical protein